jgi:hypothetical protein
VGETATLEGLDSMKPTGASRTSIGDNQAGVKAEAELLRWAGGADGAGHKLTRHKAQANKPLKVTHSSTSHVSAASRLLAL